MTAGARASARIEFRNAVVNEALNKSFPFSLRGEPEKGKRSGGTVAPDFPAEREAPQERGRDEGDLKIHALAIA